MKGYRSVEDRFNDYYRNRYGEKAFHRWDNYNPQESIRAVRVAQEEHMHKSKEKSMDRDAYEEDLRRRQKEHLDRVHENLSHQGRGFNPQWQPCMHDQCTECHGTGVRVNGGSCVHCLSCPCPRCTPTC